MCNQLYGLCHGEGIFHGLPCFATMTLCCSHLTTADFALGTPNNVKLRRVPAIKMAWMTSSLPMECGHLWIGGSEQLPTTKSILPFRSKFRPLDIYSLSFSHVFTFSTEETLPTLIGGPLWWFLCLFWSWFLGFYLVFLVLVVLVCFLHLYAVFPFLLR